MSALTALGLLLAVYVCAALCFAAWLAYGSAEWCGYGTWGNGLAGWTILLAGFAWPVITIALWWTKDD